MNVAVGQEDRAVRAAPQLLEAEGGLIELGHLRRLLGRQRDVLDPGHQSVPSQPVCEMSMTTPSGPDHFISKLAWPPADIVASTWSFAVSRSPCAPSSCSQAWSRSSTSKPKWWMPVKCGPCAPMSGDASPLVLRIARLMWPSDRNTAPFGLRRNSLRPNADL